MRRSPIPCATSRASTWPRPRPEMSTSRLVQRPARCRKFPLLVLLDGRSIYQDFFGAVLWDFVPIEFEEIKQVEVIGGPASAVWGANAMNGVVNAISKTPREMQGTSVGIRFGQFDCTPVGEPFDGGGLLAVDVIHASSTCTKNCRNWYGVVRPGSSHTAPPADFPNFVPWPSGGAAR